MNDCHLRGGVVLSLWGAMILSCSFDNDCSAKSLILVKPSVSWSVTGGDDLRQLKRLAAGVGWEFEPNEDTIQALKRIGIRSVRCINVEPGGEFTEDGEFTIGDAGRLLAHLDTCRRIGAEPHVIIAQSLHPDLRLTEQDIPEGERGTMGNLVATQVFGPRDWAKFRAYCRAVFEFVLVTHHFPGARFEVGNEPDVGGVFCPRPPRPAMGSHALYEGYFEIYRNVAQAAEEFEAAHPGLKVRLGGPALAWAFTFRYGDFNWAERFLRDCAQQRVKLDLLGIHSYGNISSLNGEYPSNYPSFAEMLRYTRDARDRTLPGLPIWITEWGPTYHTDTTVESRVNGNHMGAAWCAAFLDAMLQGRVDGALYLVTTDLRRPTQEGGWENVWGWPSLFLNPIASGKAYPKAPFHVLDMVSRLEGTRIEATRGGPTVRCFASANPATKRMTLMVWNYGARIPEFGPAIETAVREAVTVRVREADRIFDSPRVQWRRCLVSETVSNALGLLERGEPLDDAQTGLQQVEEGSAAIIDGLLDVGFAAPPSSVSFLEIAAQH